MAVWIPGGTSGIGLAVAKCLVKDNIPVYKTGEEVDVTDPAALEDYVRENWGVRDVDAIVYSVGINYLEWSDKIEPDAMLEVYNTNVVGLINVLKAVRKSDCLKRVVVVGSDAAWRPMRTSVAYNASKAALHAAVQCIARERASENFAINVVAPGVTEPTRMMEYVEQETERLRGWTPAELMAYENMFTPMGRRADRDEVAEFIVSILFNKSPYLNGAIIPFNGAR